MRYYAGIGSRETPGDVLVFMHSIAIHLGSHAILRSGGAKGADRAFEEGCDENDLGKKEIFLAKDCTPEALVMAANYHPAWDRCSEAARKLHGRNCMIMLGRNLDTPVSFVICWTKDGQESGGTGQAMRIALQHKIPVLNLFYPETQEMIRRMILA